MPLSKQKPSWWPKFTHANLPLWELITFPRKDVATDFKFTLIIKQTSS